MATMYAAVKWPVAATTAEVERAVRDDLPMLALILRDEHGMDADEIRRLFDEAADAAEFD